MGDQERIRKELDLSEVVSVSDAYLRVINISLDYVAKFKFDLLLNSLIDLFVVTEGSAKPAEGLLVTDKFYLYKALWKAILETLYKNYLPEYNYKFDWEIEISPYTLTLCEISKGAPSNNELEIIRNLLKIKDDEIEDSYLDILKKIGADSLGFPDGIIGRVPNSTTPKKRVDQLSLLFRLMTFPPLEEISIFYTRYTAKIKQQITGLSVAFPEMSKQLISDPKLPGQIGWAFYNIHHDTFKKYGLDAIASHQALSSYKEDFDEIRLSANLSKGELQDKFICPCCGELQEVTIPEEVAQFQLLINNRKLSKKVGLIYLDEYALRYKKHIADSLLSFIKNINLVKNPECLILVEGESEEVFVPIIAMKYGIFLFERNTKVYNSKSKQKLESDFIAFKEKYPKLKMICILDSDASKERDNILRMMSGHKDRYHLVYINKGGFEDLFDLSVSILALNEIYKDGDAIVIGDFKAGVDFLSNVKRILHEKKKATFDKVKFARKMASIVDTKHIPSEVVEVLKAVEKFTIKNKFFVT